MCLSQRNQSYNPQAFVFKPEYKFKKHKFISLGTFKPSGEKSSTYDYIETNYV